MNSIPFRRHSRWLSMLALAALLVTGSTTRAQEKHNFARWDKDIAAFEQRDREKRPVQRAILFVGSSSIRLWDLPKYFPGLDVLNRGFGGSEIIDSVHFAPRIVLKYRPRIIVFYAGDNDIAAGKKPEQVARDFRAFIKAVRGELPETKIIYIAIKPSIQRWRLIDRIREANRQIEAICKAGQHLAYLDIATPMLGKDGKPRPELFRRDGLHLNDRGYRLWTALLMPHLKAG